MAFMQMTFLPATFVAAIMSINMFDFTRNPPTVFPSFWLFWLVSGLLTVTVLTLYFGIVYIKKTKEKQQEEEAKKEEEQDKLDLIRPPAGNAGESDGEGRGSRRRRKRDSRQPKPEAAAS
jgi:hypothetical protein